MRLQARYETKSSAHIEEAVSTRGTKSVIVCKTYLGQALVLVSKSSVVPQLQCEYFCAVFKRLVSKLNFSRHFTFTRVQNSDGPPLPSSVCFSLWKKT